MRASDDYPALRDLGVIGDKRTSALIGADGTVEWMCVPRCDGDPVFASLLDRRRGGRFELAPTEACSSARRYLPDTNVLETTFTTAAGQARVTDALVLPDAATPDTQLVRRLDCVSGEITLDWHVQPRFDFGRTAVTPRRQAGIALFGHNDLLLTVQSGGAGEIDDRDGAVGGQARLREGDVAVLHLGVYAGQPAEAVGRDVALDRLEETAARWRRFAARCTYEGPWQEAVVRSALALDLLVDRDSGAIVAASTTSLPERIGGPRNFDYRYAWLRDANLTLEAMMRLGYRTQVQASMAWMLDAVDRTAPMLRPFYRVDSTPRAPQHERDLDGYRGSRPVHVGNSAESQLQLGNWGDLLDATWLYVQDGHVLHPRASRRLADCLDFVTRIWRHADAGLWELGDTAQYTQSKLACENALRRGVQLAEAGQIPAANVRRWGAEADRVRAYVDEQCWSERHRTLTRAGDRPDEVDAAVLLASRGTLADTDSDRLSATVDAVRRELDAGDGLLYRYSGMREREGAFVACSFWAVEALARVGRLDEATSLMDTMVGHVNDLGLLTEEIDPADGAFLGNMPQALSHLALVNAADVCRTTDGGG